MARRGFLPAAKGTVSAHGQVVGQLAAASVTSLVCGTNFVVATGLCGFLRAWQVPPPRVRISLQTTGNRVSVFSLVESVGPWTLVLSESSLYELANGRMTTHPYRYISSVATDGRFAVAMADTHVVQVWQSCTWLYEQVLRTTEGDDLPEANAHGSPSCIEFAAGVIALGSREGVIQLWEEGSGGAFKRRLRSLAADEGPVASVMLEAEVLIAVYRQSVGLVDGFSYCGQGSVCGWSLFTGSLMWKICEKCQFELCCKRRSPVLVMRPCCTQCLRERIPRHSCAAPSCSGCAELRGRRLSTACGLSRR